MYCFVDLRDRSTGNSIETVLVTQNPDIAWEIAEKYNKKRFGKDYDSYEDLLFSANNYNPNEKYFADVYYEDEFVIVKNGKRIEL